MMKLFVSIFLNVRFTATNIRVMEFILMRPNGTNFPCSTETSKMINLNQVAALDNKLGIPLQPVAPLAIPWKFSLRLLYNAVRNNENGIPPLDMKSENLFGLHNYQGFSVLKMRDRNII